MANTRRRPPGNARTMKSGDKPTSPRRRPPENAKKAKVSDFEKKPSTNVTKAKPSTSVGKAKNLPKKPSTDVTKSKPSTGVRKGPINMGNAERAQKPSLKAPPKATFGSKFKAVGALGLLAGAVIGNYMARQNQMLAAYDAKKSSKPSAPAAALKQKANTSVNSVLSGSGAASKVNFTAPQQASPGKQLQPASKPASKPSKPASKPASKPSKPASTPSFGQAFKDARGAGKKEFEWKGEKYHTKTKEEMSASKPSKPSKPAPKDTPKKRQTDFGSWDPVQKNWKQPKKK